MIAVTCGGTEDGLSHPPGSGSGSAFDALDLIREKRLRVLVVDDEPDYRESVVLKLRRRYAALVDEADSGESALSVIHTNEFDLILLDVALGGISGLDVCRALLRSSVRARIVLMSAQGNADLLAAARGLQVTFLEKPIAEELLRAVLLSAGENTSDE